MSITDQYPMEHPLLEKVGDFEMEMANRRLAEGWVFIRCYVVKSATTGERPLFVMGKPKEHP
jgi:hypothetical protein